jgi:hypothetical protein
MFLPALLAGAVFSLGACKDSTSPEAKTGSITLDLSGLPGGTAGTVRLTRGGVTKVVTSATTLDGLDAGDWTITADDITVDGVTYGAQPASQTVTIPARSVGSARVVWTPTTGTLNLTVSGLPVGTAADIQLTKGTFSRAVTASANVTGLAPGQYTITARDVRHAAIGTFRADVPAVTVVVSASAVPVVATVNYAVAPSVVDVAVAGLPGGTASAISLTSPSNASIPIGGSTRLNGVASGRWRLSATPVQSGSATYTPTPSSADTTLSAGDTLRFDVNYAISTGSLAVAIVGLQPGDAGSVLVTGPGGFSRALTATTTLIGLTPGTYTVAADSVVRSGFAWRPAAASAQVTVSASLIAAPATVQYTAVSGTLVVTLSGVPLGASGSARVTGPYGFDRTIAANSVFTPTAAGNYTITASPFSFGGVTYRVTPTTVNRAVAIAGRDSVDMKYQAATGSVLVTVNGLPGGASGSLTLTGNSQNISITNTTTIQNLVVGTYTLTAATVNVSGTNYGAAPTSQTVTITDGVQSSATVTYTSVVSTGSLQVNVTGLPVSGTASLTLTGNSQTIPITGTTTLTNLAVGSYTLTAASVVVNSTTYNPAPTSQNVSIASGVPSTLNVAYTAAGSTGSLQVNVSGLPGGFNAAITLTGNSQNISITGTTTLNGLPTGVYTLAAANVNVTGTNFAPAPASQNVTINNGAQSTASVVYSAAASTIDLVLDYAYLTQATQAPDGSVPLVAGRDALLRVFAHADQSNSNNVPVRARIYDGATLLQTLTLTGPSTVPLALTEGTLGSTWNVVITGANIRPATRILVDIDPLQTIAENDRTNNIWPRNSTPQSVTVNTVPTFNVRFVPVTVKGLTGNVTSGNMDQYLVTARKIWPLNNVNADVRATPFSSSGDTLSLVSSDNNAKWLTVLSEMNTLRSTDGAGSTTHYFGVVKVTYTSGVAGYGYVPGRAAIGWDYLPSGDGVAAHEWGHNFSRQHAPCGGPAGPDPSYPYANAAIGMYGWNSGNNTIVSNTTADVMSYCNPTWVSDYNWKGVMTYRQSSGGVGTTGASGDGLLVWGRVVNGSVILEPAFRVNAPATAAALRPTHHVEALDANGAVLLDLPISADVVDHVTDHEERQFAVVVPWTAALEEALSQVRVRDVRTPLLAAARSSASAFSARLVRGVRPSQALTMPDPQAEVDAPAAGRVRVRWNKAAYPMAMVRDASTGQVMGYLRNSGDAVVTKGRSVDVVYSDGVRSVSRRGN